jgi:hypothetical protein
MASFRLIDLRVVVIRVRFVFKSAAVSRLLLLLLLLFGWATMAAN